MRDEHPPPDRSAYADRPPYTGGDPYPAPPPGPGAGPYAGGDPYPTPPRHAGGGAYAGGDYAAPAPPRQPSATGRRRPDRPGGGPPRGPAPERDRGQPPSSGAGGGLPVGAGALIGGVGVVCVLLSLMVLPWFTAGGNEVTLADIRSGFAVRDTAPADPVPDLTDEVPSTLPDGIPSPGDVQDAVEEQVRDAAAEAAAAAIEEGKARYLELYAERLWVAVAAGSVLAVVLSTLLSPRSMALSLLLGFRWLSGLVTMAAGAAHGAALWVVFSGDAAPAIAVGAWLGLAGLGAVFLACVAGPKR